MDGRVTGLFDFQAVGGVEWQKALSPSESANHCLCRAAAFVARALATSTYNEIMEIYSL